MDKEVEDLRDVEIKKSLLPKKIQRILIAVGVTALAALIVGMVLLFQCEIMGSNCPLVYVSPKFIVDRKFLPNEVYTVNYTKSTLFTSKDGTKKSSD